jgi:hypothetical protein
MNADDFFSIVPTPEAFRFRGLNLYRIFQVEFADRILTKTVAVRTRSPKPTARAALKALPNFFRAVGRALALGFSGRRQPRTFFYLISGRLSKMDGVTYDLYNPRLVDTRGRDRFVLYQDNRDDPDKVYAPDLLRTDLLPLFALTLILVRLLLGKPIDAFARGISRRYPRLGFSSAEAAEMVSRFYAQKWAYTLLLGVLAPKEIILLCNYMREAFSAACKARGLAITELMHGNITLGHAYYHIPPAYATPEGRSLFPDRVVVYGQYWKDVLVQGNFLPEDQIVIGGYFLKVPEPGEQARKGRKMLLITSQYTVQDELLEYAAFLKRTLDPGIWEVVIKPHPAEDSARFRMLEQPDFLRVTMENTYALMKRADVHISVYSTTLFEAARYGASNWALNVPKYADRWQEYVDTGICRLLQPDELPDPALPSMEQVQYYFSDYDPKVVFS